MTRGPLGDLSTPAIDDGTTALRLTPQRDPAGSSPNEGVASMCYATPNFSGALALDCDAFISGYEKERPPFRKLDQSTRDNLVRFLRGLGRDPRINNVYMVAYVLATTLHECRSASNKWITTWSPVTETRSHPERPYFTPVTARDMDGWPVGTDGLRLVPTEDAHGRPKLGKHKVSTLQDADLKKYFDPGLLLQRAYQGRGYVQITFLDNYRAMDEALGLGGTLIADPERALEHDIALGITLYGMVNGSFRGYRRVAGKGHIGGHKLADYGGDYTKARAIINAPTDHAVDIAGYARTFERLIQQSRLA